MVARADGCGIECPIRKRTFETCQYLFFSIIGTLHPPNRGAIHLYVCLSVCLSVWPYTGIHVNHILGRQSPPGLLDQHLDRPQHVNYLHKKEMLVD